MEDPCRNMSFLIIDENDRIRKTTRNVLERIGYENILEANNGEIALEKLNSSKVDMILCEAVMSDMSGVEVLRAVRDNDEHQNIAFLMVSADKDHATVAEAGEGDVDGFVIKPFTAQLIQEKIKEIMESRHTPSPVKIHLDLGLVYLKSRQYEQALSEFRKALDINQNSPRVLLAIGRVKEQKGDLEEAEKLYLQAVKLSPQFLKAHDALAGLYEVRNDLKSVAEHLKLAAAISPRNADRQIKLGQALIKTDQKHEAREVLNMVMKIAKDSYAKVARQVGDAFLEAGMMAEAQDVLMEGLSFYPKDLHLYNRLGIAYRKQKKFREAMKNYEQAIEIDPENENLFYNLGRASYEAGDWDKSAEAMNRALQLYPDFEEARTFLKQVLKL